MSNLAHMTTQTKFICTAISRIWHLFPEENGYQLYSSGVQFSKKEGKPDWHKILLLITDGALPVAVLSVLAP